MGLIYIFPVDRSDRDRTELISKANDNNQAKTEMLVLKTYGLPMIFWGYLATILIVIALMWLASRSTIEKLLSYHDDPGLMILGTIAQAALLLTPIVLVSFFFYEKHLQKSGIHLSIIYKLFFIPIFAKKITLDRQDALSVSHFLNSPNMAKIYNKEELKGFENKGYFELHAISEGKKILLDRHSRKADLIKIKDLLSQY